MATETNEMSCKELVEVLTDYLEGTLPEPDRVRFETHLAICPGCQIYLDQMRETIRAVGTLREEHVPPEAARDLIAALRNWKRNGQ